MMPALLLACIVIAFSSGVVLNAQPGKPKAEDLLQVNSAQGKEFWIAIPPNEIPPFPVNELEIYIASAYDTDVQVYDAGGNRQYTRKVKKGEILTLSDSRGETNWTWEVREFEIPVRKAVRITSQHPISVYVLNSKTTTSDGYLAIPTIAWGSDYIHCSYYDFREFKPWAGGFIVIAKENGTQLNIDLRGVGELDAKTAGGKTINTGQIFTVSMDEGDVYMVKGDGTTRGTWDLTGSRVRSNKPVGLISFHERTTMPNMLVNGNGRNHLAEMMPPVQAWGKHYATVEFKRENRNGVGKGDVFRVVASQPNTKWSLKYYNKTTKALIGQAGGTLAKSGDFSDIAQSGSPVSLTHGYSVWTADKPIIVAQYSCSQSWDGDPILDPFMINVIPVVQFGSKALFQQPTAAKFQKHRLSLIVWADTSDPDYINNLKSLAIDSVGVWRHPQAEVPTLLFNLMPGSDNLHWTSIDLGTNAKAHTITSNGKIRFGGYLYGFGAADAYGWPVAAGFRPTTSLDTMAPKLFVDSLCGDYNFRATEFRNIPNPPTTPPNENDQVETGISEINFVPGSPSTNYRIVLLTAQTFPRDPSHKEFRFRLEVVDKSRDAYAEILVSDFGANPIDNNVNTTYDTVRYFAPKLNIAPAPLSFGKHRVGTKPTLTATLTNNEDRPVTLTDLRLVYGSYFTLKAGDIPPGVTLGVGQSHAFTLEYDASHDSTMPPIGRDVDELVLVVDCGTHRYPVSGFAVEPRIQVGDFDAGTVAANEIVCDKIRIENDGSDTLIITGIQGHQGTNFSLSNPYTPRLPIIVPSKGILYLDKVCYQSTGVGEDNVNVTFSSNAASGDSVSNWLANFIVDVKTDDAMTASALDITPQPATDVLSVTLPVGVVAIGAVVLKLIDLNGSAVAEWSVDARSTSVFSANVSAIASGSYTIVVKWADQTYAKRVVVAR